ncbi:CAAX prenyl protease-like protein [Aneurinibacillus soli]|uniref:CAAX amino terminal protease self-immunity n=2 Tax=Aneurinibacillus soli TaxID=1500254 RepID=A0A0U4NDX4_9BACL|nr:CAAX prenyl protease-like protein [Aneurinibacillus soli]BAU27108.1 CAAX amino terminal protease self- immunity [Aneurinibacillus soli]
MMKFFLIFISICVLILIINIKMNWGMTEEDIQLAFVPAYMALFFLMSFSNLRKAFMERLITSKDYISVISKPIVIGVITVFILEGTRYLPLIFNGDIIGIGSGQVKDDGHLSRFANWFLTCIIAPSNEEFITRFLFYDGVCLLLLSMIAPLPREKVKTFNAAQMVLYKMLNLFNIMIEIFVQKIFQRSSKLGTCIYVIVASTVFSILHKPDITNFHLYFLGGVVDWFFFLRYGLIASFLSHATFNASSDMVHKIWIGMLGINQH